MDISLDFAQMKDAVDVFGSLGTVAIAVIVFRWSRRTASLEANRQVQNEWQAVNIAVSENELLAVHDYNFHPFGEITREEHYKLLLYFMHLNTGVNVWNSYQNGLVDKGLAFAVLNNQANLLFDDRHFVEQHALPRGYTNEYSQQLTKRWTEISRLEGTRLSMDYEVS